MIIGLLVGCIIAGIAGAANSDKQYITGEKIKTSPVATFLWVETFPLGFYAPALPPFLIAFIVTLVESLGDVTATVEASRLTLEVQRSSKL